MAGECRRLRERGAARLGERGCGRRRGEIFIHAGRKARLGLENKPNISLTRDKGRYRVMIVQVLVY
jgi:hypothetical protein